jgi:putative transposase
MSQDFYKRNLPHWQPQDRIFFITFRLEHSLPSAVLEALRRERAREERFIRAHQQSSRHHQELYELDKKYFGAYDTWLDRCLSESPAWLAQVPVAQIVMDELYRLDGIRYILLAFCIMPNHVHLLIDTAGLTASSPGNQGGMVRNYPVTASLRLIKGRTARYCNQVLGRSGPFWHAESYDHVVRNDQELSRIRQYIRDNPIKAGLVVDWMEWPFTYVAPPPERDSASEQ